MRYVPIGYVWSVLVTHICRLISRHHARSALVDIMPFYIVKPVLLQNPKVVRLRSSFLVVAQHSRFYWAWFWSS